jgi:hypothetical protein
VWPDEERNLEFRIPRLQHRCVAATLQVRGHGEAEVGSPARVDHVVVVEMDRTVLAWRVAPVHLRAVPVRTRHGARRQVHDEPVQSIGPGVADDLGFDVARKSAPDYGIDEARRDRIAH